MVYCFCIILAGTWTPGVIIFPWHNVILFWKFDKKGDRKKRRFEKDNEEKWCEFVKTIVVMELELDEKIIGGVRVE